MINSLSRMASGADTMTTSLLCNILQSNRQYAYYANVRTSANFAPFAQLVCDEIACLNLLNHFHGPLEGMVTLVSRLSEFRVMKDRQPAAKSVANVHTPSLTHRKKTLTFYVCVTVSNNLLSDHLMAYRSSARYGGVQISTLRLDSSAACHCSLQQDPSGLQSRPCPCAFSAHTLFTLRAGV